MGLIYNTDIYKAKVHFSPPNFQKLAILAP